MSPAPANKPKSDAIPATRIGPRDELPCAGESCPSPKEWNSLKLQVNEIHEAMVGTLEKPGMAELNRVQDRRISALEAHRRRQGKWIVAGVSTFNLAVLGSAGTWIWEKLSGKVG